MMRSELEKSLDIALTASLLPCLPEPDNKERIWIRAIGKVTKINAQQSYVIIERDIEGLPRVIKDCGSPAIIINLNEVYPYIFLQEDRYREFKTKQENIDYIVAMDSSYKADKLKTMKKADLDNICIYLLIQEQLKTQR